jgi:hypothetical protein
LERLGNLFSIFLFTNLFLLTNPAFGPVTLLNPPLLRSCLTYWMLSIVVTLLSLHCSMSAAFDTVDHAILLDRIRVTFVVRDTAFG